MTCTRGERIYRRLLQRLKWFLSFYTSSEVRRVGCPFCEVLNTAKIERCDQCLLYRGSCPFEYACGDYYSRENIEKMLAYCKANRSFIIKETNTWLKHLCVSKDKSKGELEDESTGKNKS